MRSSRENCLGTALWAFAPDLPLPEAAGLRISTVTVGILSSKATAWLERKG